MQRETISSPKIQGLADKFHWVSVDIDRQLSVARAHGVRASPEIHIFDPAGALRARFVGFFGPVELRDHLRKVLARIHETPAELSAGLLQDVESGDRTDLSWTPDGYRGDSVCFSHVGYGPLRLTSQSPFQALRLGLTPRTPSTLARKQIEVRWSETWSNIWARDVDYALDYETLNSNFALAYGIADTLQVELQIWSWSRFGGIMDPFIQGFHDLANIGQNGRDLVPKGDFTFDLAATGSEPAVALTADDRGSFSRSVGFTFQHNVTCGTQSAPAFSYAVTARLNLEADDIRGGDDLDLGASVAVARRFGQFYGYLSLGHAWFGNETFRGVTIRPRQISGLGVVEWRYAPRRSVLAHYLVSEGVAESRGDFSKPSNEVTIGWKGELRRGMVLEIGLIENIFTFDNSPDFGIHGGVTYRF